MTLLTKKVIALFLSILVFAPQATACAHGDLISSNPKASSVVTKIPKLVWVEFDGKLITIAGKQTNFLSVKNSKGQELGAGKAVVSGRRISVEIKDRSALGKIKVSWRVVSEDGHPVASFLTFTVRK